MFAGWVRVRTRSDPKGRSTKQLALAPTYTGPGQQYLARTLGPPCGVRSGPRSARARTGPRTVYGQTNLIEVYAKCWLSYPLGQHLIRPLAIIQPSLLWPPRPSLSRFDSAVAF